MFQQSDATLTLAEAARVGEPDWHLAALLAPEHVRQDLLAVAALAAELSRIADVVREPMMGEIRLQWWRESLSSTAEQPNGHSVIDGLRTAKDRHRLSLPVLLAMTEAHAFDLYDDPMPDEVSFEGYLDKIYGAPFALTLQILGANAPAALADHAGRAYGRLRLLTSLPLWLSRGRNPLPPTYFLSGDGAEDFAAARWTSASRQTVDRLIGEADRHFEAARRLARDLPRHHRVALLPLATIPPHRTALRRQGHDPLRVVTEIAPLTRVLRIARAHWLGV